MDCSDRLLQNCRMITLRINGEKFPIPTEWSDVSFKDYINLLSLPNSLLHYLHLFTGIPLESLQKAQIANLEKIALALSFLTIPPKFEPGVTKMVGPYVIPEDVTLQSLGQFEDLKALLQKVPQTLDAIEDVIKLHDLYGTACAIYIQKLKHGEYNFSRVPQVREEIDNFSCTQVIQTGSFFLFRPLTISKPTATRFQIIAQRLRKSIQDLPGYQKTLEYMHRSFGSPEK